MYIRLLFVILLKTPLNVILLICLGLSTGCNVGKMLLLSRSPVYSLHTSFFVWQVLDARHLANKSGAGRSSLPILRHIPWIIKWGGTQL